MPLRNLCRQLQLYIFLQLLSELFLFEPEEQILQPSFSKSKLSWTNQIVLNCQLSNSCVNGPFQPFRGYWEMEIGRQFDRLFLSPPLNMVATLATCIILGKIPIDRENCTSMQVVAK